LKHYNNTGKVQTDYQEGNREVDHKTWLLIMSIQ
jgi:hypothetical protein